MITVEEAEKIILENTISLPTEEVSITDSIGRILAEELRADRDFPPFDRVTMDGIAIRFEQLSKGLDTFRIEAVSRAGSPLVTLQNPENCIEVMTGTMLPANTDTVIRYEDLEIDSNIARIIYSPSGAGGNIHRQGFDRKAGDLIIEKGRTISSAEVGVAATIGKSTIKVTRTLKAVIVSTGDEIVPITETPERHQIRTSNGYALQALLKQWGIAADNVLLPDNQEFIESEIKRYLQEYDTIILSGGVSAGKFDFVPKALENQGVKKLFHKVEQRPGKPFWFGVAPSTGRGGTAVFALPGNPVSTFMCLNRYFKKWLDASLGIQTQQLFAELAQDFNFKPDLTFFLQVKLQYNFDGKILAKPIEGHGSGDLANLADADAFIELPKEKTLFKKGESYKIYIYRN